ncbi:DNA gyrase inhibitor YacG [Methylosoma difficile]
MGNPLIVKCPTCKRPVPWLAEQTFKPFCCQQCKLIDLGEWVMEEKKIPGDPIGFDDIPFEES